ncbi:hypothetical protein LINPERPRIM_LOCUS8070 [Linum perenne]
MSLPREVVDVSITSPGIGGGSRIMPIDLNEMSLPREVVDVSITSPGESSTALDLNEVVEMIEVADPGQ